MSDYLLYLRDLFFEYTAITSQSNPKEVSLPSTPGQWDMVKKIEKDLRTLGVKDIQINDNAVLIARIKGRVPAPVIAFMAHVDTVDIGASPDVKAQLISYQGRDIVLNTLENIVFKADEHPEAAPYIGQEIFFTDGTSVLGADDKAGVSVLTALAKFLVEEKPACGDVVLIYAPDEEIGLKGAYSLNIDELGAHICYTIDGGEIGRLGYETFNAAGADILIEGVSIHPGTGKDRLVNPILAANHLITHFNPLETPEHTELRQGYFWIHDITGNPSRVSLEISIRDFDLEAFGKRKEFVKRAVDNTQKAYPKAKITCTIKDRYANIANSLTTDRRCISLAEEAYEAASVPMNVELIRGGTDGSVLSAKGLTTPNIFTGGLNGHSVFEFLPLRSLLKSFEVCTEIIKRAPKYK